MISGRLSVSRGQIELNGQPIHNRAPHEINRMGLSRSFQITSLFHRLSVFENVRCALLWSRGYRLFDRAPPQQAARFKYRNRGFAGTARSLGQARGSCRHVVLR